MFLNDVVRDRAIPLTRIDSGIPQPKFAPVPATPPQLEAIAKHFQHTDGGKPENLPLVANALMANAQTLAANEEADWRDPAIAAAYLKIVLGDVHHQEVDQIAG